MPIASNPLNIRMNGTGRLYVADVGSSNIGMEIGEMDGLSDSIADASPEKIFSNRVAGKVVIGTVPGETEGSISYGMRESSIENLQMAYASVEANITSQLAGNLENVDVNMVEKEYVDVGKSDCFLTKLGIGAVAGGPFQIGENVVGGASSATGQIAWVGAGYLELIDVSGTFSSGETLTGSVSTATAPLSSIQKLADMVVCDAASATVRYELETDYRVDADYGFIMKMPGSSIGSSAFISCSHDQIDKKTIHAMSASNAEKKLTFVTDKNDKGPRMKYTYHRVSQNVNGDVTKIGDGEQVIAVSGVLMADLTRPVGQQYVSIDLFE